MRKQPIDSINYLQTDNYNGHMTSTMSTTHNNTTRIAAARSNEKYQAAQAAAPS